MINEDRMLKTLTFVNVHKHIKALFIMIIKWLGIIDDTLEKKADLIGGKVPAEQLPSYVDDVIDIAAFNGIIYYGNVENNVYNIIAYKTFYSLLYSSSDGGVN